MRVAVAASRAAAGRSRSPQMPTNTPVRLPASRSGACPACSSASQATSSSSRCCGSMLRASRGEMPKNCGSKRSTCVEEAAAARVRSCPARRGRGRSSASTSQRSAGTSRDRRRRRRAAAARSASGSSAPPGKRQPMPMTAIGSRGARSGARRARACISSSARKARFSGDSAASVGVLGRRRHRSALEPLQEQRLDVSSSLSASTSAARQRGRRGAGRPAPAARRRVAGGRLASSRSRRRGDRVDRRVVEHQRRRQRLPSPRPGRAGCAAAPPSANRSPGPSGGRAGGELVAAVEAQHAHDAARARARAAARAARPAGSAASRPRNSAAARGAARSADGAGARRRRRHRRRRCDRRRASPSPGTRATMTCWPSTSAGEPGSGTGGDVARSRRRAAPRVQRAGGEQRVVAAQVVGEVLPALDQPGGDVEPGEVGRSPRTSTSRPPGASSARSVRERARRSRVACSDVGGDDDVEAAGA